MIINESILPRKYEKVLNSEIDTEYDVIDYENNKYHRDSKEIITFDEGVPEKSIIAISNKLSQKFHDLSISYKKVDGCYEIYLRTNK